MVGGVVEVGVGDETGAHCGAEADLFFVGDEVGLVGLVEGVDRVDLVVEDEVAERSDVVCHWLHGCDGVGMVEFWRHKYQS